MTQKEHADVHRLPLHAHCIDHPDIYLYPSQVSHQAQTRDSCLRPRLGWLSDDDRPDLHPWSPLVRMMKGTPMDLSPLQQARQIYMTARAMRIKAETAYLEAQRKQIWAREQQESLRWQHPMHDAPRMVIALTA